MDKRNALCQIFRSHDRRILQRMAKWSSPCHRVTMKGNKARYSIGLFTGPRGGYLIEVPKELVDDKNPLLFKPNDYVEFLKFYSTQLAQGALSFGLKAYCSA
ncbi:hypothetical protein V6N13_080536 [Hibiscus sabdariffa]